MKLQKLAGATSEIWQVFVRDSSSTTGGGLTGLVFNTASLTAYYHRDTDTTATVINLVTMTVGTFTSSGFKEIDSTNMPGWYQFCPPNAAIASGAKSCGFHLKGATNMAPLPIEVQLTTYNPDATLASQVPTAAAIATGIFQDTTAGDFTVAASVGKSIMNGVALGTGLTINGYTGNTPQTGDSFARIGVAGAGLTALGDTRIANLDAAVSSRMATYTQPTGFLAASFPSAVGDATAASQNTINSNVLTRLATAGYTAPDNASIALILGQTGTTGVLLASAAVDSIWAKTFDGSITMLQVVRGWAAALLGKASGLDVNTPTYRNINDTKNVISAVVDASGNRTTVVLDLS